MRYEVSLSGYLGLHCKVGAYIYITTEKIRMVIAVNSVNGALHAK